jgi:hypothetical protein
MCPWYGSAKKNAVPNGGLTPANVVSVVSKAFTAQVNVPGTRPGCTTQFPKHLYVRDFAGSIMCARRRGFDEPAGRVLLYQHHVDALTAESESR